QNNIYSGSEDKTVRKISTDGNEIWKYTGHTDYVKSTCVDSNNNIYSGSNDKTVRKLQQNLGVLITKDNQNEIHKITKLDTLVKEVLPNPIEIWRFNTNSIVRSICLDLDNNIIIGNTSNRIKKIAQDKTVLWEYTGYSNWVRSVCVDSQNNIISGSDDKTVKKLSTNGTEVWSFTGHLGSISSICVDSKDNIISTTTHTKKLSPDGVEIWDYFNTYMRSVVVDFKDNITMCGNDRSITTLSSEGVLVWKKYYSDLMYSVAIDSKSNIVSGSYDFIIRKTSSIGDDIWTFLGHTGVINHVHIDSEDNIYSGSDDKTVKKLSPNGTEIWSFSESIKNVYTICTNSKYIYIGELDHKVVKLQNTHTVQKVAYYN
ncbi:TPA: WD40 repeat domain-containing protein, partial [Clostridioides difficile]